MRRFAHGLGWGAAATLVMGTVSLVLFAIGVYGTERPLSVMLARNFTDGIWVFALAAFGQLLYGALSGGLLAKLSSPVTMPSALGVGLLRWLVTQMVMFGLMPHPLLAAVTLLPHLAWALSAGWLMHRDDEHVPGTPLRLLPARSRPRSRSRGTRNRI